MHNYDCNTARVVGNCHNSDILSSKWLKSHLGVDDQSHLDDIVTMIRMTLISIIRVFHDVLQDDDEKY